jgi:uncharacterized protein
MAENPADAADRQTEATRSPSSRLLAVGLRTGVFVGLIAAMLFGSPMVLRSDERPTNVALVLSAPPRLAAPAVPEFARLAPRSLDGNVVSDPALVEDAPIGPLPVTATDGRAPITVYARPFDKNDKRKRIAVIIAGLNISATNTKLALARLPAPVTLAFVPFAFDGQASVDLARAAGHEVLLQVPMEPFDFPESDPGPHALMAAASTEENLRRLSWSFSRFTGYVGIMNLLGARLMSEEAALEAVLNESARRGLLFVDDGASKSSLALTAARHTNAAIATGTVTLDSAQSRIAVDQKLAELEVEARRNGSAIGIGSAFPVTIARVAVWAEALESRGFVLVPISALAVKASR